jgi:hypothetical protein
MKGDRMRPLVLFLILLAPFTPAFARTAEPKPPQTLDEQFSAVARQQEEEPVGVVQQNATAAACAEANPPRPVPAKCYKLCTVFTCGGQLWGGGLIRYHITRSIDGRTFTDADVAVIQSAASAWNNTASGVVVLQEVADLAACQASHRCLDIQAASAEDTGSIGGNPSYFKTPVNFNTVAHELGHSIGLPHTFARHDRDRYVSMSQAHFCPGSIVPNQDTTSEDPVKCKQWPSADPSEPSIPTGSFGQYDSRSVMNYASEDICEDDGLGPESVGPRSQDGSAAIELYRTLAGWSPFQSLGQDVGATTKLNYDLASGVTTRGDPALSSWGLPALNIFVRGSDGHVYYKYKNVSAGGSFQSWSEWTDMSASGVDSNPASTSWGTGRIDLVVKSGNDGAIWTRQNLGGAWQGWWSLGKPAIGIAAGSSPAITTWGPGRLDLFVRGADEQMYTRTCNGNSTATCSTAAAWSAWTLIGPGSVFWGSPAATSEAVNKITVAVHGKDNFAWTLRLANGAWTWSRVDAVGVLAGSSASTASSPGLASFRGANSRVELFVKGSDGRLWQNEYKGSWSGFMPLGGDILGSPVAFAIGTQRIEVAAVMDDHGLGGVWRKYFPWQHPCYTDLQCGSCGCGGSGQPPCVSN